MNGQEQKEDNKLWRYVLAGTASTIMVELSTHFLDTLNIQSKLKDKNKVLSNMAHKSKRRSPFALFRGYQAVFWGYLPSSIVYFYIYGSFKERWMNDERENAKARNQNEEDSKLSDAESGTIAKSKMSFLSQFFMFMMAASRAELSALMIYYPFDLIKTRMQGSNDKYGYTSITDALVKILRSEYTKSEY